MSMVEYGGVRIQQGDKVLMNFPAACHDPEHFENPDEFIIDRQRNRHVAFGSGIHRMCGFEPGPIGDERSLARLARTDSRVPGKRSRLHEVGGRSSARPENHASLVPRGFAPYLAAINCHTKWIDSDHKEERIRWPRHSP